MGLQQWPVGAGPDVLWSLGVGVGGCRGGILVPQGGREAVQVLLHPLVVMDAQSQGHIPLPGKRHFPIDLPSKEVCPRVGRSAQAPSPERLRNAMQNDHAALSRTRLLSCCCDPHSGAAGGWRPANNHIWELLIPKLQRFSNHRRTEVTVAAGEDKRMGHEV